MKNLIKIFVAVVALFAFSCATDTTNDLGANLAGQTTLTLSLDGTRTHIEGEVGGVYPMYWSEGDQISVNGVASAALTAAQAGKTSATFTLSGELATPYCVAYPAAEANKVLFASNQVHNTNTTFGNGVSTMYGYGAKGVELHHLTGVLKIGVTGTATLTHAQISTADRAPIAGAFDIDFTSGEVTPSADAVTAINYSFGSGVTLSSEPTYMHIAVPAGVYGELYVTLYDSNNGVMYATVKANDTKPLTAGNLRSFTSSLAYKADESLFVIRDAASLKAFKQAVEDANNPLAVDAVLVADVDLAGEAWTSIEGYAKTLHGNGYAIKGLTAPLFGTTSASIKSLHLKGVNINETANPNVGAFARTITATDTVSPSLEHCSASGSLVVNCTSYTLPSGGSTIESFAIGGLVGYVKGVDFAHCTNEVALDVDQVIATSNTTNIYLSVAGIAGLVNKYTTTASVDVLSDLNHCENKANIDVHEVSYTTVSYDGGKVIPYVAGIAGRFISGNAACTVSHITNRGNISVQGYYGLGVYDDKNNVDYKDIDPCVAGAVAYLQTTNGSHIYNYGKVTYTDGRSWHLFIGGTIGMLGKNSVLANVENHGEVTLSSTPKIVNLHCAGVAAHTCDGSSLTDCENNGKIAINAGCTVNGKTGHRYFRVGGIVGFSRGSITNCSNEENIDCSGSIAGAPNWQDVAVGGIAAVAYSHSITNCQNNSTIKVAMNNSVTSDAAYLGHTNIGGIVGIAALPCNNVTNNSRLIIYGNVLKLYLGGCAGYVGTAENANKIGGYTNNGILEFRGASGASTTSACKITTEARIGGCVGSADGATLYNLTNNEAGVLNFNNVNYSGTIYVGGCLGYGGAIDTGDNHAPINYANDGNARSYVSGVAPCLLLGGSNLTNHKTGIVTATLKSGSNTYVSGVAGFAKADCTDFVNEANLYLNGATTALTMFSGVLSNANADNVTLTRLCNKGDLTLNGTFSGDTRISGLQTDTNMIQTWDSCYNSGTITVTAETTISNNFRVGGLLAYTRTANKTNTLKDCYNTGDIVVEKGASFSKIAYIGGLIGHTVNYTPTINGSFYNSGNISVLNAATATSDLLVGGVVGNAAAKIIDASCVCDINVVGMVEKASSPAVGVGFIVGNHRGTTALVGNCKLSGRLAFTETNGTPNWENYKLGGIFDEDLDSFSEPLWSSKIYGGSWNGSSENYDGCSYLAKID